MHAVFDEESQRKQRRRAELERQRQECAGWIQAQIDGAVWLSQQETDPTNVLTRLGRPMTDREFEGKLLQINPQFKFKYNQFNSTKKALYYAAPSELVYICPYEAGFMPERSLIKSQTEEIPDPDWIVHPKVMNRKDLPKHEWVPGKGWVFEKGAPRPGWKTITQGWGEAWRGWRTILLHIVKVGLDRGQMFATPEQIERVFGGDDTRQWAAHTGRRKLEVRW